MAKPKTLTSMIAQKKPGMIQRRTLTRWYNRAVEMQQTINAQRMIRDMEQPRLVAIPILSTEQLLEMADAQRETRHD